MVNTGFQSVKDDNSGVDKSRFDLLVRFGASAIQC